MKGLGWNPELLGSAWPQLEGLDYGPAYLAGEAALAGYWLHHRGVEQVEVLAPDLQALTGLRAQLPGATSVLELPGFIRLRQADFQLDLALESSPALDRGPSAQPPVQSLRDLAADRWLRLFCPGPQAVATLVDLYFLQRARVDLLRAARDMSAKDAASSRTALAVVLHELRLSRLPDGLVRPLTREALEEFRRDWVDQLGMEAFS